MKMLLAACAVCGMLWAAEADGSSRLRLVLEQDGSNVVYRLNGSAESFPSFKEKIQKIAGISTDAQLTVAVNGRVEFCHLWETLLVFAGHRMKNIMVTGDMDAFPGEPHKVMLKLLPAPKTAIVYEGGTLKEKTVEPENYE